MNQFNFIKALSTLLIICLTGHYAIASTDTRLNFNSKNESKEIICEIFDLVAEAQPCTPNNVFFVEINFEVQDPGVTFSVNGNGNDYGDFEYSQLPITVGPLAGDGTTIYEFVITDNADPNCSAFTTIDPVLCDNSGPCAITDLIVEAYDCDPNGQFLVDLDFNYTGTSDSFSVVGNGMNYGTFAYADLFITIGPFEGNGQMLEFIVIDQEFQDCSAEIGLTAPNCGNNNCEIGAISFEPACDGNVSYGFINFDYANTSDSFNLTINNDFYTFAYTDLPVNISPLPDNGNTYMLVTVSDQLNPNCANEVDHEAINCEGDCSISGFQVSTPECNPNGGYNLTLSFDVSNPGNDFFDLYDGNGNLIGFYPLNELPLTLENYEPSQTGLEVFQVCINDNPNCCAIYTVEFPECGNNCEIWDLVVEASDCNPNGIFYVDLDFNFNNTSDSFSVVGNGMNYGTFAYTDLFITIGPFEGNGQMLEFIVIDQEFQDCSAEIGLTAPNCGNNNCEIGAISFEPACDGNVSYGFINFDYANTSDSFNLTINNDFYTFAYTDLPVNISPLPDNGNTYMLVTVSDQLNPNCANEVDHEAINCEGDCSISGFQVSTPECNPNGGYNLTLSFDVSNPGNDFFDLYDGNGNLIGFYPLNELPLTLENYEPSQTGLEVFQVCINDNPNCCAIFTVEFPPCGNNCAIAGLIVEAYDCDPNGLFWVDLNFSYTGTSDSFSVVGNGMNYGTFAYTDLYITLGPFEGNGQVLEFIVIDQEFQDCSAEAILTAPNCNNSNCAISGFEVSTPECNPNGGYNLTLSFDVTNPGNDFFDLYDGNGNLIGFYPLNELPLTLENYEPTQTGLEVFQVCINDNPNCCAIFTVEFPPCGNNCAITGLIVEAYDCDPNGLFWVDLNFSYTGTSDSFSVVGNGMNYGTFAYTDLYITLGPFEGNGQVLEFIVIDQEFQDCSAEAILTAPNCNNSNCEIWDLVVDPQDCNNDGSYNITINFNYANPGNDFFNVFDANGNNIGFFALADLPVLLNNFDPSGNDFDVITVCINDQPNCCTTTEFLAPNCNNGDCSISGFEVSTPECNPNGGYNLTLSFDVQNPGNDFFDLYDGNGNLIGFYPINELPLTLENYEPTQTGLEVFQVCINDNPNCCAIFTVEFPPCGGDCEIWDLVVDPQDCNNDGTYNIIVNFNYANAGNDFFDVFDANGNNIGFYELADLPVNISNFVPSGNDFDVLTVCINDQPNCCATTEFLAPNCNNDCLISGLTIEPFCDGTSLYAEISFDYNGNGSDQFQILSCAPIDTLAYNNNGVYTIQIPDNLVNCAGGEFIPIGIFDLNDMSCGDTEFLFIPDCYDMGCTINEVEANVSDCDGDVFVVTINFEYEDVGDNGFSVLGNGQDYGDFEYNQLPITLGPFVGNGQGLEFIIIDNDDEECWNFIEITAPNCVAPPMSCIEFEGLTDGLNYGGSNSQPGDLLMIENNVYVTMEGVPDPLGNLNYDYMFATTQDICNPFDAANGNRVFMFNGLRFNFAPLTQNPTLVTFPYHNCGIPFAISVNDQQPVTYLFPQTDTTFNLSPTVVIDIQLDANNSEEGVITLQGFVETFFIGGVELQIDNVCFNVENLIPDVWPGDANFDNTANNFDLLNVGIAFGVDGPERDFVNIDWFAMPADDWDQFYEDEETNYKHADCNGDGVVNITDRAAILENYNFSHGPTPIFVQVPGTPDDPSFFVDLPEASEIEIGVPFEAPIILGTLDNPIDEIYGIAFTIEFDPEMMNENQVSIELGNSWMGIDGQNLINLDKKFAQDGKFEIAITRTNQENVGGFGTVGHFIGIIDDILGKSEVEVVITKVKAIRLNQTDVPLNLPIEVIDLSTNIETIPVIGNINIFPNPTIDIIHVVNDTNESVQEITVYNVLGQLMTNISNPQSSETINVSNWAAGIYFVKVELETQTVTQRIKKTKP
jgi:type IX secretion system substrate protein